MGDEDDDDARKAEMELLEAMYSQDGEYSCTEPFACTLRFLVGDATLELAVTLPQGYPTLPPRLRATCPRLSRRGEDALAEGMLSVVEANAGESCMTTVLDWLQDIKAV